MDPEEMERQRMRSEWQCIGAAVALEQLKRELMLRAGTEFVNGKDDAAKLIREIAISIGKRALDERKRQKDFQGKTFSPSGM